MNLAKRIGGLGLAAFVAMAGLAALPGNASAQVRVMATAGGPGGGGGGQVSKRSIERYAELLGLSAEQKDSALAIHEGYAASYQEAQKSRRAAMEDMRRSSEDTGDHTVFMEKMPKIEKEFRDRTQKLEKGLFDDMKALLSGPAQEGKWVRVERMRRRELNLRGGISGAAVDLTDVVTGLKLPAEAQTQVGPVLEDYERELDAQLLARAKAASEGAVFEPGKPLDADKLKKQMQDSREAGLKVKEVNERSARKIEPLLPEDKRAAFRDAVRERSFPQVYRPSRVARGMDAAMKLDDLSPAQRASISEMKAQYQREAASVNDAWAAAITQSEGTGDNGMIMGSDGGHIMLNMADEPAALVDARKARRDLDDKMNDKLKGVLNESQQAKVAKSSTPDGEDEIGGVAVRSLIINDR